MSVCVCVCVCVGGPVDGVQWTVRGDTVRVGCLNRINELNGSAVVMRTRLSWRRQDLGKVSAGGEEYLLKYCTET